jgi:serine protease
VDHSESLPTVLRRHRLALLRPLSAALGLYLVEGGEHEDGAELASRLSEADGLQTAVPDLYSARHRHQLLRAPNDPRFGGQWYLAQLGIEHAWQVTSGARSVTVAIVDDGCDLSHPDLASAFVGGRDVLDRDDDPSFDRISPGNAHGTACAGIVGARADNGIGIAGVCPHCSLSCIKLLGRDSMRLIPLSADIEAFEYAFEIGAAVVSNSWGYAEAMPVSQPLSAAIERIATQGRGGLGTVVVFAAGNDNRAIEQDELVALPWVVNVGAVNNFDEAAPFANFGSSLDLSAPTGSLTTDISGPDGLSSDDYTNLFGGTSAACPVIAGVAGLMLSHASQTTAEEVQAVLKQTARRAPYAVVRDGGLDLVYGYGIVDPASALMALARSATADAGSSSDVAAFDAGALAPIDADSASSVDGSAATQSGDASSDEVERREASAGDLHAHPVKAEGDSGCSVSGDLSKQERPRSRQLWLLAIFGHLLAKQRRNRLLAGRAST